MRMSLLVMRMFEMGRVTICTYDMDNDSKKVLVSILLSLALNGDGDFPRLWQTYALVQVRVLSKV